MDTIGVTAISDSGEINLYFLEVLNGILEAAAEHVTLEKSTKHTPVGPDVEPYVKAVGKCGPYHLPPEKYQQWSDVQLHLAPTP